jgi:Abnormal spindle-like microcephaly-assoc'd, ASPM-SPD-2-Hydin/Transmembrane protein 131-like N-terminal
MRYHAPWCSETFSLDGAARQAQQFFSFPSAIALVALILFVSPLRTHAASELTMQPSAAYFGSVWVGRTHSINATLKNSGTTAITISGDTLTGSGYSVNGLKLPKTLNGGQTLAFTIEFSPTKTGNMAGSLRVMSNAENSTLTVPLYGDGVTSQALGYATASPMIAQFGNVPVGTENTEIIDVKNTGEHSFSIASVTESGTGFLVSGISTPVSVAPGNNARFTVGFLPKSAGSASGSVNIKSTASDSQLTIVLSGTGVGSSQQLTVTPANIAFGSVNVSGSTTQQITLKNTGNSNIAISSDTVQGSGLHITGVASGTSLTPGQTAVISVEFAPTAAGSVVGAVTITSNATDGTVSVPVTGTGVAATHAVDLQWQASSSSGVVGYDVYRSTVSGGSYGKLTSSPVAGTSYSDTSVSSGVEYFYVVTAVNSNGTESTFSNQVATTIP